jgi:acyl-coenzyme A synthetase/AMP-(fatty) acid ligase
MRSIEIGSMDEWFPPADVPHFHYHKTFEQAQWDPVAVLHTSGSTGLPKPIVARVGMVATGDAFHNFPELPGTEFVYKTWSDHSKRHFMPGEQRLADVCIPLR